MTQQITGEENLFAIQWEVLQSYENDCYGSLCFWIGGEKVGDFENEALLDVSLYQVTSFNKHKNIRSYKNSHILSKEKLFHELHGKFFGESAKSSGDYLNLGIYRAIFWVTEIGEASLRDKFDIILLDEPLANRQRLIWKSIDISAEIREHFIPLDYFEKVISQYYTNVNAIWKG